MAGPSKTWFDRILRTEGAIAFGQQIWSGVSIALGSGLVTAVVTSIQGALEPFGFAGFVVVGLVVSILVLALESRIAEYKLRKAPTPKIVYINFDAATSLVFSSFSLIDYTGAAKMIVQLASEGKVSVKASRVISEPASAYLDTGPSINLQPETIQELEPFVANVDFQPELRIHGNLRLKDGNAIYGKVKVNLNQLTQYL